MAQTLTADITLTPEIKAELTTACSELAKVLGSDIPVEKLLNIPKIREALITKYCTAQLTNDEKTRFKGNLTYNTTRRNDILISTMIADYKEQKIQEIADSI